MRTCDSTEISCRFCFCGEDAEPEGELVSPCACLGTQVRRLGRAGARLADTHADSRPARSSARAQRFVHLRCLRAWQRVSQLNGSAEKALKARARRGAAPNAA